MTAAGTGESTQYTLFASLPANWGEVKLSILWAPVSLSLSPSLWFLKSFLRAFGSRSPHPPLLTFPIVLITVILVRGAEYFMKVVVGGSEEVVEVVVGGREQ